MFGSQTTEIQPFKVECFLTQMHKFQQYDVIIYDVSVDFGILIFELTLWWFTPVQNFIVIRPLTMKIQVGGSP